MQTRDFDASRFRLGEGEGELLVAVGFAFTYSLVMATVLLVGGALAVGGAAVAAAGGGALAYRQHKKHKKHKEKKHIENAAKQQFGMHLEDLVRPRSPGPTPLSCSELTA